MRDNDKFAFGLVRLLTPLFCFLNICFLFAVYFASPSNLDFSVLYIDDNMEPANSSPAAPEDDYETIHDRGGGTVMVLGAVMLATTPTDVMSFATLLLLQQLALS